MQPQEMKLRLQRATDAAVLRGDVAVMIEAQTYDLQERIQHLQGRLQAVKDASDVGRLRAEALATMGDEPPDVILADYHLENGDTGVAAIEACLLLQQQPSPSALFLAVANPRERKPADWRKPPLTNS